eukprot:5246532-Pyramimonas_sp.AAC.1
MALRSKEMLTTAAMDRASKTLRERCPALSTWRPYSTRSSAELCRGILGPMEAERRTPGHSRSQCRIFCLG